jgi:hypothetical protein
VFPTIAALLDAGVLTSAIGHRLLAAGGGGVDKRQFLSAGDCSLMPRLAVVVGCFVVAHRPEIVSCSG